MAASEEKLKLLEIAKEIFIAKAYGVYTASDADDKNFNQVFAYILKGVKGGYENL